MFRGGTNDPKDFSYPIEKQFYDPRVCEELQDRRKFVGDAGKADILWNKIRLKFLGLWTATWRENVRQIRLIKRRVCKIMMRQVGVGRWFERWRDLAMRHTAVTDLTRFWRGYTARVNRAALQSFFQKFPELAARDFLRFSFIVIQRLKQ